MKGVGIWNWGKQSQRDVHLAWLEQSQDTPYTLPSVFQMPSAFHLERAQPMLFIIERAPTSVAWISLLFNQKPF